MMKGIFDCLAQHSSSLLGYTRHLSTPPELQFPVHASNCVHSAIWEKTYCLMHSDQSLKERHVLALKGDVKNRYLMFRSCSAHFSSSPCLRAKKAHSECVRSFCVTWLLRSILGFSVLPKVISTYHLCDPYSSTNGQFVAVIIFVAENKRHSTRAAAQNCVHRCSGALIRHNIVPTHSWLKTPAPLHALPGGQSLSLFF